MQRRSFIGSPLALAWAGAPAQTGPDPKPPGAAAAARVPGARWEQLAPDASGWRAAGLNAADAAARKLGSDAVLVVHRGAVVHAFGRVAEPMNLYSVRKSVLGMLVGMHIGAGDGQIDLDATLASLGIDDKQPLTAAEKTATVRQLPQSRSGVYHPAAYEMASWAAVRPARGSHAPGSFWYYNNWDFNALATIFRQRTGRTVFDALDGELAQPLQFEDFDLQAHTRWVHERASLHPAYVISLSARDLTRLGVVMARGGTWGGRRLLPAGWVADSTAPHSVVGAGWQAYGQLWWVPQRAWPFWQRAPGDVFFGDGNFGQFVLVDRARDLVIVHRTDGPRLLRQPIDAERVSPLLQALLAACPDADADRPAASAGPTR